MAQHSKPSLVDRIDWKFVSIILSIIIIGILLSFSQAQTKAQMNQLSMRDAMRNAQKVAFFRMDKTLPASPSDFVVSAQDSVDGLPHDFRIKPFEDVWHTPLRIETDGTEYVLWSAGRDGDFGSGDDVFLVIPCYEVLP